MSDRMLDLLAVVEVFENQLEMVYQDRHKDTVNDVVVAGIVAVADVVVAAAAAAVSVVGIVGVVDTIQNRIHLTP